MTSGNLHFSGLFVFSYCYLGAALKAAVINWCQNVFNVIGIFHEQTSVRRSGGRQAGNECHLATCMAMDIKYTSNIKKYTSITRSVINCRLHSDISVKGGSQPNRFALDVIIVNNTSVVQNVVH